MPDEIDVLRWFRADAPGPDEAAWERARTAIAQTHASDGETGSPAPGSLKLRRGRWRGVVAVAITAAVTAAAVGAVIAASGTQTLSKPLATAWQPARPLPTTATSLAGRAPAGTWRLMGYLSPRGWQENMAGPEPGPLTCPTALTCYVEGDNATSASGPADMDTFYVSTDGAHTWSVLPVPAHTSFTSPLSCTTAPDCVAGGLYYGHQPVLLRTTTGGHSWTVTPMPDGTGTVYRLDCAAAGPCRGLASASGMHPSGQWIKDARFVSIGGGQVTVTAFPDGVQVQDLSCPTATMCVAAGTDAKGIADGTDPIAEVTLDGGASWRRPALPATLNLIPYPEQVTCVDASHCRMLGFTGDLRRYLNVTLQEDGPQVQQIQDAYAVVAFSDDGGMTWRASAFPKAIPFPQMYYLACPTATTCYAAGSALIPQRIGNQVGVGWNDDSPVVAVTHDAGRSWQRITFQVPTGVPSSMLAESFIAIGTIQCPQADVCVALGVSAQGTTSTPVYTNRG